MWITCYAPSSLGDAVTDHLRAELQDAAGRVGYALTSDDIRVRPAWRGTLAATAEARKACGQEDKHEAHG